MEAVKFLLSFVAGLAISHFYDGTRERTDVIVLASLFFLIVLHFLFAIWKARSARELWFANREAIALLCGAGILIFACTSTWENVSFWGIIIIGAIGAWLGSFVANVLGWDDDAFRQRVAQNERLLQIAASLAKLDGRISDSEHRQLVALGARRFNEFHINFLPLIESFFSNDTMTAEQCGKSIASELGSIKEAMLAELCHVLFADGDLDESKLLWLRKFLLSGEIQDFSIVCRFTRITVFEDSDRLLALQTLGLLPGATQVQIKAAYKELAKKYHPDRQSNLPAHAEELVKQKMLKINEAYAKLTDSQGTELYFWGHGGKVTASSFETEIICQCWLCSTWMKIPIAPGLEDARCLNCHALAGVHD